MWHVSFMKYFIPLFILLFCSFSLALEPVDVLEIKINQNTYAVEELTSGHGVIWSMDFVGPDQIIFAERAGTIGLFNLVTGQVRHIQHRLPIRRAGQGGLLDIALSPDAPGKDVFYVTYSKAIGSRIALTMAKFRLRNEQAVDVEELFSARPALSGGLHFGGRITFDEKGHVFVSHGDRGSRHLAQKLNNHMGKILRFNMDGSVPRDNPFVNSGNAFPEIWTYGHRNPQGLFYDKTKSTLYSNEHGPKGGDEINTIEKGKNYGWPVISYGSEYGTGEPIGEKEKEGMEQPMTYFIPSIAPSSLLVYRSDKLPDFKDHFISGALALRHLNLIQFKDNNRPSIQFCEKRLALALGERVREIDPFQRRNILRKLLVEARQICPMPQ